MQMELIEVDKEERERERELNTSPRIIGRELIPFIKDDVVQFLFDLHHLQQSV